MSRNFVRPIRKGETITAGLLSSYAVQINRNTARLGSFATEIADGERFSPSSNAEQEDNTSQEVPAIDSDSELAAVASTIFSETGRSVSTVRVENPLDATQFVDVERIEVVRFRSLTGETMLLVFDN